MNKRNKYCFGLGTVGRDMFYTLESMIADLEEPAESVEFRMNILLDDFKAYGQTVIDELTA